MKRLPHDETTLFPQLHVKKLCPSPMQLPPEVKAQLQAQKQNCIFCKIVAKQQKANIIFEDSLSIATLDIYPAVKGHTIFMLKEHYPIMPYIPVQEFEHFFGLMPQFSKIIKEAMVTLAINIFIANGGVAGQQSTHFLVHLLPRESGDTFWNFMLKEHVSLGDKETSLLANGLAQLMATHFKRYPAAWHQGPGDKPAFLQGIQGTAIYEDEKILVVVPEKGAVAGHIVVYSKGEQSDFAKLSADDSVHMFYVASFAATAVFEGLRAQGTNIILKSGKSEDSSEGRLAVHILPRYPDDSLQELFWQMKPPSYDLEDVAAKIKDKTWKIHLKKDEKDKKDMKKSVPVLEAKKAEAALQEVLQDRGVSKRTSLKSTSLKGTNKSPRDEIRAAMEKLR